jgi:hypothetical protein
MFFIVKINAALISSPMRCHSGGCGTARWMTQSDTRSIAAVHVMLSFAFMMTLAT